MNRPPPAVDRRRRATISLDVTAERIACLIAVIALAGCALPEAQPGESTEAPRMKLLIYGGPGQAVYLGCLTCDETDPDSVHNPNGNFGNRLSMTSILNGFSDYGSRVSNYSVCNPLATDPPLVVDEARGAHGRLTVNKYSSQAFQNDDIFRWLETEVCR